MIGRLIYRVLIRLHPANFRDRHGDEMLCIFDESAPEQSHRLIADASLSLARQWFFHSAWWKFLAGAAVSSLLILGWAYSVTRGLDWSINWAAQRHAEFLALSPAPPDHPLNEVEFEREAQQAVQMLAQYRRQAENRRHHRSSGAANAPDHLLPTNPLSENRD